MKNNVVEVKQEHIDEGVQGCPCYCAVSLAVYEALEHKYKFYNNLHTYFLSRDELRDSVPIGESWVETAVAGAGAEISIFTKLEDGKIVEDYIAIEDEAPINSMNALALERWIEDFDTFDNSEPTSFKIEDIHRMNN